MYLKGNEFVCLTTGLRTDKEKCILIIIIFLK